MSNYVTSSTTTPAILTESIGNVRSTTMTRRTPHGKPLSLAGELQTAPRETAPKRKSNKHDDSILRVGPTGDHVFTNQHCMLYYANARSLRNKTIALEMLLSHANYDVLSIVETYLSNSDTSAKCLVGSEGRYDLFRYDRDNRKGGGVAIFCERVLNPVRLNFPEDLRAVEAVCIELTVASRQRILCVYRPPICSNNYNEHMCQLISHCSRNMANVIITNCR